MQAPFSAPVLVFYFGIHFLTSWHVVRAGINDSRFQRLFRVDLTGVPRLPWKDWVKKHVQTPNGFPVPTTIQRSQQISCSNTDLLSKHISKGACCDMNTDTCDSSINLQCIDYRCSCRVGTFHNENTGKCDQRNGKKLSEACNAATDNCYTAFSVCQTGVCQCMDGFKPDGLECVPTIYRCPYGDPLMSSTRPTACDVNESDVSNSTSSDNRCPSGYECIYPSDPYRPKYSTFTGIEKSYCCPLIPDLSQNILFQDQCYYGDWVPPLECPPATHVYAFAISSTPLCCPKPCRPNYSSTIIKGQCLEGLLP